jgi:hypothetical protein
MKIFIEGGTENKPALKKLSNELYGKVYAARGLSNFYYGFTPYTAGYEQDYCDITFEVKGTLAQLEFLKILQSKFKIIRIDAEDEEKEKEAIAQWEQNHEQKSLPKKVSLPIVIIRLPASAKLSGIYNYYPSKYQSKDRSEKLIITNEYTMEGIKNARSKYTEVTKEEYKKIHYDFDAPEKPESALP